MHSEFTFQKMYQGKILFEHNGHKEVTGPNSHINPLTQGNNVKRKCTNHTCARMATFV